MARLFPPTLPNSFRAEPKRRAELKVYDACKKHLGVGWDVYYHVAWLGATRKDGTPRDGEADFVIAHKDHGLIVLEVKGGGIRYDGATMTWWSTDRDGVTHAIKDPVEQARVSKHVLLRKLQERGGLAGRWISISHAVVFPDLLQGQLDGVSLPIDLDRAVVICHDMLPQLASRLRSVADYWQGRESPFEGSRPADDGLLLAEAEALLAPVLDLPNPLQVRIAEETQEILRLTERQFNLLSFLSRTRRAAIEGCAGSGKTALAVHKAEQLAREGFRTLLTCRSPLLAVHLAELTRLTRQRYPLEVFSFSDLCRSFAARAQIPVPSAGGLDRDDILTYREPEALELAVGRRPELAYDAILVDEAQDFKEVWWVALGKCLAEGHDSIFYVFHDNNQRVYRDSEGMPTDLQPYPLTENVRNTRAIHRLLVHYYQGGESLPIGPAGSREERHPYADTEGLRNQLGQVLAALLDQHQVAARDVIVLTPRGREASALGTLAPGHGVRLVAEPKGRPRDIFWCPVEEFKGLERPVVVVAELERDLLADEKRLTAVCYVAFSRPRNHLLLLGHADVLEALASA